MVEVSMPLRIKLLRPGLIPVSYTTKRSINELWQTFYRPPSHMLFQIAELVTLMIYVSFVLIPTQYKAYLLREVFKSVLFQQNHESPIWNATLLNQSYFDMQDSALQIQEDFIMDVDFPNASNLVYHYILYVNGTKTQVDDIEINTEVLKDVTTITTNIPIYVFSEYGCSKWNIVFIVSDIHSNPAFWLSSKIHRNQCDLKKIENLFGRKYNREDMPHYINTCQFLYRMIPFLIFHLTLLATQLARRIKAHRKCIVSDIHYQEYKPHQQFHFMIGVWLPCEIFAVVVHLVGCVLLTINANSMSEMPDLLVLQMFSLTIFFMLLTLLQFFRANTYTYHFVAILREGIVHILDVFIGFIPIISAFFLAGIFMFATIAPKTRSLYSMLEILISFTLGDNIEPTYNEFSDGTPLFNWMAFIYITLLVLVAGWVVFASFTATVQFIDERILMKSAKEHAD